MKIFRSKICLILLLVLCIVGILLINLFNSEENFKVITNQLVGGDHGELQNHDGHRRVFKGKMIFNNISHHFSQIEMEEVNSYENWVVIVATRKPETVINDLKSLTEAQGSKWCCVILLDTDENSGRDFFTINSEKFVVLARKEIKELIDSDPGYSSIQTTTFHSFTNFKNIGYIYAIRHGAKLIFDAHEDYRLTEGEIPYTGLVEEFLLVNGSNNVFNPYKYYYSDHGELLRQEGLPVRKAWNLNNFRFEVYEKNNCMVNRREICVMQFMTKYDGTPERYTEQKFNKLPLVMERGTHMPYASHATLHHYSSFFGLRLPFATKDKLADAMRAYYAQRLMWDIGTNIAVSKPLMGYLLDTESTLVSVEELHVSVPDHLITFLHEWHSESNSLIERMEELAIKFYEMGFWEEEEVYSIQKWIQDLGMAGYKFPKITPVKNEEYFLLQKEGCQIANIPTPGDEQSKNNISNIANRGKLEIFLRMSTDSIALKDLYNEIFDWSLRFFWHNELSPLNLMLILDDENEKDHEFGKEKEKVYPYPTVHFEEPNSYYGMNGHNRMQWSMFWADQFSIGEYVGFSDTDTLFITLIYDDLLFEGDKPIVWGYFGAARDGFWSDTKINTYHFLKKKQMIRAMNYFPVIVKVKHLPAVREYIEKVHEKPFNDVFQPIAASGPISQFNIIVTFLWYFHRDEYVWHMEINTEKGADGPDEITDFHDVTDEMRVPSPKLSVHYKYIYGIKMKLEPDFNPSVHTEQTLKTRNSLMLEGYCYSYGFKNTPGMCTKFDANAVQQSMYEFEDHTWAWDERCITSQQKHYSSVTDVKHEWDPEILSAISKDLI